MTTSYKTGNRLDRISVTTTLNIACGSIGNWINGSDQESPIGAFFPAAISDNTGKIIRFEFAAPRIIDEARSRQGGAAGVLGVSRGNWQWRGVDGSEVVNIGEPFLLGGAASQVHDQLSGNTRAFPVYELVGVGGAVSDSGWMLEIEFKEDGIASSNYAEPRPNPWPQLVNPIKDRYSVTIPSQQLAQESYTTIPPAYRLIQGSLPIVECLPGDIISAWWHQGFTTSDSFAVEVAGLLMLERLGDSAAPLSIFNAGPTIDFRCLCENRGTNVIPSVHHGLVMFAGETLVLEAGDYVVTARAYASPGAIPAGIPVDILDGDLIVWRERGSAAS